MLTQTKINHLQLRLSTSITKEKVLQLQIPMNNPLRVNVTHTAQHLLNQSRTLRLGIMIIRLLVQTIEQLSPQTKLLHQINLRMTLVHLLQPHDIRVIQLTHNVNLLAQLLQPLLRVHQPQIQTLDCILEPRGLVRRQSDQSRNSRPQDGSVVHPRVDLLDGLSEGDLDVNDSFGHGVGIALLVDHFVESEGGGVAAESTLARVLGGGAGVGGSIEGVSGGDGARDVGRREGDGVLVVGGGVWAEERDGWGGDVIGLGECLRRGGTLCFDFG
mmetsp:Transcript_14198/g.25325  ORF Transcript_14198/g.25325 Transcript_14198/m.25325 type:complete len:272 (-) Transcript_14198:401-1216(-)